MEGTLEGTWERRGGRALAWWGLLPGSLFHGNEGLLRAQRYLGRVWYKVLGR